MDINKLVAIGSITTGLLFLLMGGIFAYMLFQMNTIISGVAMVPGGEAIAGMMSPFLIIGWIFTTLSLVSGLISLITGIIYFVQKP